MTTPSPADAYIDALLGLFTRLGHAHYGEDISQIEHATQTAHHAVADDAPPALVAAALLHDVGHLLQKAGEDAADRGVDTRHEDIGAGYLARAFGPDVSEPVRLHVSAKRYLALSRPGYVESLSQASQQSLFLQGGPMTHVEAEAFLAKPAAVAALRLRRFDEMGKVVGAAPAGVETYRALLLGLVQPDRINKATDAGRSHAPSA